MIDSCPYTLLSSRLSTSALLVTCVLWGFSYCCFNLGLHSYCRLFCQAVDIFLVLHSRSLSPIIPAMSMDWSVYLHRVLHCTEPERCAQKTAIERHRMRRAKPFNAFNVDLYSFVSERASERARFGWFTAVVPNMDGFFGENQIDTSVAALVVGATASADGRGGPIVEASS